MARTTQEQLDACDAKIAKIEAGLQSYSISDRSGANADLAVMYVERGRLERKLERESPTRKSYHPVEFGS